MFDGRHNADTRGFCDPTSSNEKPEWGEVGNKITNCRLNWMPDDLRDHELSREKGDYKVAIKIRTKKRRIVGLSLRSDNTSLPTSCRLPLRTSHNSATRPNWKWQQNFRFFSTWLLKMCNPTDDKLPPNHTLVEGAGKVHLAPALMWG
jgi:hypothetical protein